ncbi:MAG: RNA polymerase sigma-54 factor [Sphingomonadaceae bacterium]|jgi:RNA polymerase sigma-54 factor|nr:RNA polymerase sigma-54 factor [Sphingomonadaceae bacterium]
MALGPRLDLRQSQSLVMTPQLQQAIKLLALSNLEIEAFIAEEVERNPLLDAERDGPDVPAQDSADEDWADLSGDDGDDPVTTERLIEADLGPDRDGPLDVDYAHETFHHDSAADGGPGLDGALGMTGASGSFDEDGPDFENFAAAGLSLHTYLMQQAGASLSGAELMIAGHIIAQIDEAGYLLMPLADMAQQLGVTLAACEDVLQHIQGFDPTGVGARSLAECIALQAKEANRYDPAMARLLDNLDVLALGRLPQLKRICGVDDEDLADMIRELRSYTPKPGLRFGGEPIQSLTPDIFVSRRGAGWAVEINSASLPRLLVNRSYYTELLTSSDDKKSRAWLNECLTSANWLIKTLDQRQRTILKVATELVRQQDGFFRHGVSQLKPLTLRQIADVIAMHESTVSRVTSNKYLACDRGVFELKYFFTSSIAAADGGDAISAEAVKSAIRTLIQAEDPKAILSDDTLVDLLKAQGFDLARRTVAKYREAMGIGSSVQRRRQKALGG